ncbi:MAG: alanine racemase [bacterium]
MRISRTKNISYPTVIINPFIIKNNIKIVKELTKKDLILVLKSNAYGLQFDIIFDIIKDLVNKIALNNLKEFFEYKVYQKVSNNFKVLLLFPEFDENLINQAIQFKNIINFSIFSYEYFLFLKEILLKKKVVLDVELEIDTGMNRTGIKFFEINKIQEVLDFKFFNIKGVYTHLRSDNVYDIYFQLTNFKEFLKKFKNNNWDIHFLNSVGVLRFIQYLQDFSYFSDNTFKDFNLKDFLDIINLSNYVRIGILIYGIVPSFELLSLKNKLNIKNAIKIKLPFIGVKEVLKNESVGYFNKDINGFVDNDSLVALVYCGYSVFPFSKKLLFHVYDDYGDYIANSIGPMSMDITEILIRDKNLKEIYLVDDLLNLEENAFNNSLPVYNYLTGLNSFNKVDFILDYS